MSAAAPAATRQASETAPAFRQQLGLFDATMLVAGTMIGSGIFIVSAEVARDTGTAAWLLTVWVLTGVMTIMGALSYSELAGMMPQAGGQYVFLREAYSPLWGFLYGWAVFLVIQTGSIAAVSVAFAKFLGVVWPALGVDQEAGAVFLFSKDIPLDWKITFRLPWMDDELVFFQRQSFNIALGHCVAVVVTLLLSFLNCLGVREGKWVQNIFSVTKTLALVLLIVVGLTVAANLPAIRQNLSGPAWSPITQSARYQELFKNHLVPRWPVLLALMVMGGTMTGSLFAADSWSNVTFTAGEVRNPRRNLGWSMMLGAGLVIGLYLLANLAYLAALPVRGDPDGATAFERGIDHARGDRVGTAVLEQVSPRLGVPLMALAIMVSTFGCVNGMILMGARLYYAMARDGLFFRSVGRLNRRGVPAAGLILQGLWSVVLVFSGTYDELLDYVMFAVILFYALTVVGLFVLRRKVPDALRPYRVWGYPVVPAIYVLLCSAVMLDLLIVKPVNTWPGLFLVLAGIPVYFVWSRKQKKAIPVPEVV